MQATAPISARRLDWLLRFLLTAAVLAVFWPVLRAGFVDWDDEVNIVNNPHLGFGWENIGWMFTDTSYVRRYLPLGWLSYAVDHVLFGGSPTSYHLGNLLLHCANALVLYAIINQVLHHLAVAADVRRRTVAATFEEDPPPNVGGYEEKAPDSVSCRLAAAAGALFWALNPLRAEPVAWASSRIYCVATLFFFLAVLAYLQQGNLSLPALGRRRMVWLAAVCFGLSLFTYPIALGGLVVFVVIDVLVLRRLPPTARGWARPENRGVWSEKLFFLIPVTIMFAVNFQARLNHPGLEPVVPFAQFSVSARLFQALWVWAWLVWKPWLPFDLAPKYPDLLTDLPFTPAHVGAALLVLGITLLLGFRRRSWSGLLALWICHLALLAPLTGVTEHPHHTFDRYGYLVGGLWAIVIGGTVLRLSPRLGFRPVLVGMALWCCLSGWLAQQQALVWGDSLTLQTHMAESLQNHPQRASHDVVAATLLLAANHPTEAAVTLRQAIALQPELPEAWGAFGDALAAQNRLEAAVASYRRALNLKPQLKTARQNLAVTLATAGRAEEAVGQFTEMLREDPRDASAHYNLALVLKQIGRMEEAQKQFEEFRRCQSRAPAAAERKPF